MSAHPVALPKAAEVSTGEDLYMIAMPLDTYRVLSDVAAKRGMTFAQALKQALDSWIDSDKSSSTLLTEQSQSKKGK